MGLTPGGLVIRMCRARHASGVSVVVALGDRDGVTDCDARDTDTVRDAVPDGVAVMACVRDADCDTDVDCEAPKDKDGDLDGSTDIDTERLPAREGERLPETDGLTVKLGLPLRDRVTDCDCDCDGDPDRDRVRDGDSDRDAALDCDTDGVDVTDGQASCCKGRYCHMSAVSVKLASVLLNASSTLSTWPIVRVLYVPGLSLRFAIATYDSAMLAPRSMRKNSCVPVPRER